MSPITCGSIHEGREWFSDDSRGRQEIIMCLAVLLCEQFCRFSNGGAKVSIKSYFMRSFFCLEKSEPSVRKKVLSLHCLHGLHGLQQGAYTVCVVCVLG